MLTARGGAGEWNENSGFNLAFALSLAMSTVTIGLWPGR